MQYLRANLSKKLSVQPAPLVPLHLLERGNVVRRRATAMFSQVPFDVARRELEFQVGVERASV